MPLTVTKQHFSSAEELREAIKTRLPSALSVTSDLEIHADYGSLFDRAVFALVGGYVRANNQKVEISYIGTELIAQAQLDVAHLICGFQPTIGCDDVLTLLQTYWGDEYKFFRAFAEYKRHKALARPGSSLQQHLSDNIISALLQCSSLEEITEKLQSFSSIHPAVLAAK